MRGWLRREISCGTSAGQVVAIDYSAEAIELARKDFNHPSITYLQDDAQSLIQVEGSFDLIVAFEIFEHVREPNKMIERSNELLKPNGWFICSTPNVRFTRSLPDGVTPHNPFHVREYSAAEFSDILSKYFSKVELFGQEFARLQEVARCPGTFE